MKVGIRPKVGDESGSVLVVTLLIIFAVGVMGATLAMLSAMDLRISGNQRTTTQALDVAEAGLSEAIHRLSLANPTNATIGGWTGNVAIGDNTPYDPNWETRVYLMPPGSAPNAGGSIVTTGTIQDPSQTYLQYSVNSGTDDVLTIRHKWEDRNGDGVKDPNEVVRYDSEQIPPENFASGFPVEIVTVTGRFAQANRTVEAEVTKRTLLARTLGAIYIDKAISFMGNPGICGHNHNINTPAGTKPFGCFGWHEASAHLPGVATTGDEIQVLGGAVDLAGDPTPTDTSSANPFYTLSELLGISQPDLNQMLANADNTSPVNPLDGITYFNGDEHINSNTTGTGLLYCTGDLIVNGTLSFKGLIYVEGDVKVTGDCWVLGSVVVRGKSDFNTSAGNAGVLYSKEAISNYIGQYMPMIILSWREL
ncbi:MAG: pilus assembly PilX N-terminal domain-containing protein [Candidatus Latescibacterota bacterium]|nr:MAG: pilus assembly PilX N-terminal domain-containing protein [Candidatus Latescibacterota bacterium]